MFETAVIHNEPSGRRVAAACLGVTGQALLVGGAVLLPLLFPEALPVRDAIASVLFTPTAPPPAHVEVVPVPHELMAVVPRPHFDVNRLTAPAATPTRVDMREDPPEAYNHPVGVLNSTGPGVTSAAYNMVGEYLNNTVRMLIPAAPVEHAAAPVAPAAPAMPVRVPVGGKVKMAVRTFYVDPVYPPLARATRISGEVKVEGVIGVDGAIKELRTLSGHPLLVKAALDAVRQWRYEPTLLNGNPVEVLAPITVTFRLN